MNMAIRSPYAALLHTPLLYLMPYITLIHSPIDIDFGQSPILMKVFVF